MESLAAKKIKLHIICVLRNDFVERLPIFQQFENELISRWLKSVIKSFNCSDQYLVRV